MRLFDNDRKLINEKKGLLADRSCEKERETTNNKHSFLLGIQTENHRIFSTARVVCASLFRAMAISSYPHTHKKKTFRSFELK